MRWSPVKPDNFKGDRALSLELENNEGVNGTSRRTVLKGAAWAAPVVAVAASAPLAAATTAQCVPPTIPSGIGAWNIIPENVHQSADDPDMPFMTYGQDTDGTRFVRSYAEAGWIEGTNSYLGTGTGRVWGITELGNLEAGAYTYWYALRANYGTQAAWTNGTTPDWFNPDPNHVNSFASSIQGFFEVGEPGTPEFVQVAATPVWSTRDDGSFPGAALLPGVGDSNDNNMDNKAWTLGDTQTRELPVSGNWRFVWTFTKSPRDSRLIQHYPADAPNPPADGAGDETKNDDIDATLPSFISASCL